MIRFILKNFNYIELQEKYIGEINYSMIGECTMLAFISECKYTLDTPDFSMYIWDEWFLRKQKKLD